MEEAALVSPEGQSGQPTPTSDVIPDRTRIGTPVDGERVLGALSPSRAGDFRTCPLMYRLRTIDRLPERPSPIAVRGTVVHKVLEDLFDLAAADRTPARAEEMVQDAWAFVLDAEPELASMFVDDPATEGGTGQGSETAAWLASCRESLRGYFDLEDPRRLEPAEREVYVEALLDSRLLLRGFVDRIDIAPDGALRVVDYKTGHSPGVGFEGKALFQMRFYALVIWRTRGVVPALLQLIYLGDGQVLSYRPDEQDLRATERLVEALWHAIEEAHASHDWQPRPSVSCRWCSYQEHCPAFGNEPPPLPEQTGSPAEGVQHPRPAVEPDGETDSRRQDAH
jgi:putative RecB family exonuclease